MSNYLLFVLYSAMLPSTFFFTLLVIYFFVNRQYRKTEYYQATHNRLLKTHRDLGLYGEYSIYKELKKVEQPRRFLFNVYLPKQNEETTEIDVLLISQSGIFVFESKNYSGWIFGSENQKQWTQTLPRRGTSVKTRFLNPIMQNELHLKWLKSILTEYDFITYHSAVVFSDRCTLKKVELTQRKAEVFKRRNITAYFEKISKQFNNILTPQQVEEIYKKLAPYAQASEETKAKHIENIRQTTAVAPVSEPVAIAKDTLTVGTQAHPVVDNVPQIKFCSKCGREMVLRTAKTGENAGKQFWGCSGFPKCRNVIYH
ncbi:MAG TPA: NERD domain-containing protein [Clostridiales bacterium]|nr:MAG: Nuclease-related domain protein [Firmicutes bacterium ADurb.Bin262]HOU09792.1 NERD domain-containing protein [Clostridiales bacterium]HQH62203.1 NERD domain-containing protein [Clostridiales bacterium]HQK74109.1 NERD domain-containing protein [Clostridiales bacterium]